MRPRRGASPSSDSFAPLVEAARAGDLGAMETLLVRAQEVAYRFSLTVCGHAEDAEDVMQEALLRTYRHVGRIEHPEFFRSWLYRTVKNVCLMRRRRRVDEPKQLLSLEELAMPVDGGRAFDVPDRGRSPEELLSDGRVRRRLREALRDLPTKFRLIVFLRDMEGLSTREVARVTGLSEANVKTRLHRARLLLQNRLRPVL